MRVRAGVSRCRLLVLLQVLPCSALAPAGECILSRMALLLLRFSYKAWIFGALFYWATWLLLVVSCLRRINSDGDFVLFVQVLAEGCAED